MKSLMKSDRYFAVDLTHVLTMIEGIMSAALGHNSTEEYLSQVKLLFLFSFDHEMQAYFHILPEEINSVTSLKLTIEENDARRIVLVADTGFSPPPPDQLDLFQIPTGKVV